MATPSINCPTCGTRIHVDETCPGCGCKITNPPRYEHKCKRCGETFTNIVKDCDYCCVCEIRTQREEWP